MAYTELVKNFNRIRDYMREFYVYGFKSREEYTRKSARSYDDERRRIESWLGDYMGFRRTAEGKNVFLSIDSRIFHHNPLYKAWKTKSFTDGDITLHFVIMDIMEMTEEALPVSEIAEKIDEYLSAFPEPRVFDESTVRKKLKEYVKEGLLETEKHGKILYYKKAAECDCYNKDILDFFSETAPCGVIGSFLLDRRKLQEENQEKKDSCQRQKYKEKFAFKHHYITSAIDSEILCQLFQAIHEKRSIIVETIQKEKEHSSENKIIPLKILISVQGGRQYLMAYVPRFKRMNAFRIDNIVSVKFDKVSDRFDELRDRLEKMKPHIWEVSTQNHANSRMETVEFTVHYEKGEVYDATELIPWIRTFICRITDIHISNIIVETQFKRDLEKMYQLYGIGGEEK